MRTRNRYGNTLRAALVGAVVAAVVLFTFPVIAAVGGNMILGKPNTADATTFLTGAAPNSNLRIINSQAGAPALDLRVVAGSPPLRVNSAGWVRWLNADRLDGKNAAAFSLVGHNHAGVYLPVGGKAADSDLLDGQDSSAFARRGLVCPPGEALVGYGRQGPTCSSRTGSAAVDTAGNVGQHTSLVLDANGFPVISYYHYTNGDLKVVRCGNATCSAGNTLTTVDAAGDVGWDTSLVLDANGNPVISYFHFTNGDLKVARCGNPTCTSGNTLITVDSAGNVGQHTSLVLDANGYPVISYYDISGGDLKVARCGNATCTSGNTLTTVDSAGNVGQHTSLVLDANGNPVISYYDLTNGDLKVARCGNPTCTSGNTLTTVDAAGDVGQYTSLVLDANGYPVISYYDLTNGDLKLARCGNPTCTAGNTLTTVDSTGNVGQYTSLVLGANGYPVISYYDSTNTDLKVAHCGDATCSAGNTLTTVDSTGDVGYFTSLVLDANGNPIISYYDITNGDLKVAALIR
ncbi:MAG: hypothetical protein FJ313_05245, partial [Gemmatimonadetes bacterium]|nr:hypothetical protein [Gemmatimonadota bacterium]